MSAVERFLNFVGGTAYLCQELVKESLSRPIPFRLIADQIYSVGVKSFPLILIVSASTGMVMALQFGVGLEKFGGKLYIPKIVSLSIVRELGPVLACLMMAARVGAGITSEIGSMKVTQQLDAIRALGTSPIKKIVLPRVAACMIAIPILAGLAIAGGVLSGLLIGTTELGLDAEFYLQNVSYTVTLADYYSGMGKSVFFAFFIAITSCYFGLRVDGGTRGVGSATTQSVVTSSILIVSGDYVLTKIFLVVERWM